MQFSVYIPFWLRRNTLLWNTLISIFYVEKVMCLKPLWCTWSIKVRICSFKHLTYKYVRHYDHYLTIAVQGICKSFVIYNSSHGISSPMIYLHPEGSRVSPTPDPSPSDSSSSPAAGDNRNVSKPLMLTVSVYIHTEVWGVLFLHRNNGSSLLGDHSVELRPQRESPH